jgi:hypothetical protein
VATGWVIHGMVASAMAHAVSRGLPPGMRREKAAV